MAGAGAWRQEHPAGLAAQARLLWATGKAAEAAVAQGLAYGAGKPVLPIDTLLAVAEDARAGRAGAADGQTTPFLGGWQAGVLASPAFSGRPDSAFSIGVNQGMINARQRANARDAGDNRADRQNDEPGSCAHGSPC